MFSLVISGNRLLKMVLYTVIFFLKYGCNTCQKKEEKKRKVEREEEEEASALHCVFACLFFSGKFSCLFFWGKFQPRSSRFDGHRYFVSGEFHGILPFHYTKQIELTEVLKDFVEV